MASTVEKLRLAGTAAPRFRDLRKRKIRTESGRELDTSELGEALLRHAEIELAITEEVARRYCRDCGIGFGYAAMYYGTQRCKECDLKRRRKNVGIPCESCGGPVNPTSFSRQRRSGKPARCIQCYHKFRVATSPTVGKPNLCATCGASIETNSARQQRNNKGLNCDLSCDKCARNKFRKHFGQICQNCNAPLTPDQVANQRARNLELKCPQCRRGPVPPPCACGAPISRGSAKRQRTRRGENAILRCRVCFLKSYETTPGKDRCPVTSPVDGQNPPRNVT